MAQRNIAINKNGDTIPVTVEEINGMHEIRVDGVLWVRTENQTHAAVLFHMLADHVTEYVCYEK